MDLENRGGRRVTCPYCFLGSPFPNVQIILYGPYNSHTTGWKAF